MKTISIASVLLSAALAIIPMTGHSQAQQGSGSGTGAGAGGGAGGGAAGGAAAGGAAAGTAATVGLVAASVAAIAVVAAATAKKADPTYQTVYTYTNTGSGSVTTGSYQVCISNC